MEDKIRNLIKKEILKLTEGMSPEEWEAAKEKERLDQHPEKEKIMKIKQMMDKEKDKSLDESTDWKIIAADLLGFIPLAGEPADFRNAAVHASRGEFLLSALNIVSMLPEDISDVIAKTIKYLAIAGKLSGKALKWTADTLDKHQDKIYKILDFIEKHEKTPEDFKSNIPKIKNTIKHIIDGGKIATDVMIDKNGDIKPLSQMPDKTKDDFDKGIDRIKPWAKDYFEKPNYAKDHMKKVSPLGYKGSKYIYDKTLAEAATQLGYLNEDDMLNKIEKGVTAITGGGRRSAGVSDRGDKIRVMFRYMRGEFAPEEWDKILKYLTGMGFEILDQSNYYEKNWEPEEPAEAVPMIHLKKNKSPIYPTNQKLRMFRTGPKNKPQK